MIQENQIIEDRSPQMKDRFMWFLSCGLVTAIATFVRFFWLELKPLHHDEGVNGFFLTTLFREGVYKYDPANYHGPDLYYIALVFTKLFGLNTLSIRWSVAIFGVLTVILAFFLKDYIGKVGSLAAALFLSLSPGMSFISRYFIHEILFVFFSFGIAVSVLYFIEKRKAGYFAVGWVSLLLMICFIPSALTMAKAVGGTNETTVWALRVGFFLVEGVLVFFVVRMLLAWDEGRPIYLILAMANIIMLFATKETGFITVGTMAIACVCVWLWRKIYSTAIDKPKPNDLEPVELTWARFSEGLGDNTNRILIAAAVSFVFIYVGILFFSSFFTYKEGVWKAFEAYMLWTKTGSKDHTQNGTWAYIKWGMEIEAPILILSALGSLIALFKARHRFAIFTAFWAFGLFAAYTIIPYKTPWLALSFLLPMCIIAGYGINEMFRGDVSQKGIGAVLAIIATGVLAYQSYDINFVRYDDEEMPYIYAHTKRGFLDLIKKIDYYAEKSGKGKDARIEVVSPDYWSMPWYLNDYKYAVFTGNFVDANTSEMIVAKKGEDEPELVSRYVAHYKLEGEYPLRPGVDLYLLVRKDLAEKDAKELYTLTGNTSAVSPEDAGSMTNVPLTSSSPKSQK
ncbi:MAG TPA: glycosyltransferase family 39 protein [Pyrinomonadaceae bacterium]|nr:glycosyltransferase family 39 protein [Pyrinomonadaceae bacterium]